MQGPLLLLRLSHLQHRLATQTTRQTRSRIIKPPKHVEQWTVVIVCLGTCDHHPVTARPRLHINWRRVELAGAEN